MKVSILGLGYVGVVSAACLAKKGHIIVGGDIARNKVDAINSGLTPIVEAGVDAMLAEAVGNNRVRATLDVDEAVLATDLSLVCVGTPSLENGDLNISAVKHVCSQIGAAIARKGQKHTIVIRSTVLPGTLGKVITPILEDATRGRAGETFRLAHNPEFLREGTAVYDFFNPPITVIGATDPEAADVVASLYAGIDAQLVITSTEVSEMVKYVGNVWHALKVCFGNEIGNLCKAQGVDSHEVMKIFSLDRKLNISPHYLKPAFAFGGSCLPKDTRAIVYRAKELDLRLPLLGSIMDSNRLQVERALNLITSKRKKRIGICGFSFKNGTDDLRESPVVELIERLIGKGYDLRLYDSNVILAALHGANRNYILNVIPHISNLLMDSLDAVLERSELVVIGNHAEEFETVPSRLRSDQLLVDLVRLKDTQGLNSRYDGINWVI